MTDPMASLIVKLDAPSNQRWSGTFPIEVRDCAKLVLKAKGVSDDRLEVPPGRYFVTAMLPNGQQASVDDIVHLQAGEQRVVEVSIADLNFPTSLQNTTTVSDSIKEFVRPVTQYFTSHNAAILKGNWLGNKIGANPVPLVREPTTRSSLEIKAPNADQEPATWIEISAPAKYLYVAVPVDQGRSTTVQWEFSATGEIGLHFDFNDGELNSFFDFIRSDQALEARFIGRSMITQSEQYVADKSRSPLRAVLGAYVLLRANELDGMEVWTRNLLDLYGWLPDVVAIRVEYLARVGDHTSALDLLLSAPKQGAPWFRSGIGYMEKRAKLYTNVAAAKQSSLPIKPDDLPRINQIAATFSELASALDMSHVTSVFRLERMA